MRGLEVARYIVNLCLEHDRPVSNLRMQKILYLAHVYYIMKQNKPLIKDDFEAWLIGPIIPEVYREYSIYAGAPIIPFYKEDADIDTEKIKVVEKLIINLSAKKPWELVELTHMDGGAWDKTYRDGHGNREVIPLTRIYEEAGTELSRDG